MINLSADKRQTLQEAARVLKPGGRFAVTDVIADPDMDETPGPTWSNGPAASPEPSPRGSSATRWRRAGFDRVEIRETHRVHEHTASAIVRARKG